MRKPGHKQIFELIALADGREAEDYEKVLAACDRLTGNLFTETMEDNDHVGRSPVRSVDSRLFLGHFLDADNNVRDIREWNQTAVLNFKRKQPREAYECMLDYQDTMLPSNSRNEPRLGYTLRHVVWALLHSTSVVPQSAFSWNHGSCVHWQKH